jgi:NAD(P)-dependent dehydrogenase (short-subunit alcohol dehydrogenase family)
MHGEVKRMGEDMRIPRLENAVAVITGAASGIGAASAERFVREGARVVVADISEPAGSALALSLGDRARFVRTDVSSEPDIERVISFAVSEFGRLDVMFNNASIVGALGSIRDLEAGAYERTLDVVLRSVVFGTKHAARAMGDRGGVILNTSSSAAYVGGLSAHVYTAAKAAILGFTRSVAAELRDDGIRVNAIVPGLIATAMGPQVRAAIPGLRDGGPTGTLQHSPSGLPEDIAGVAAFLASDDARFITGEAIVVDGGFVHAGQATALTRTDLTTDLVDPSR